MAEMWKRKNLAEKMLLIAIAVHFLGFFLIPMAELSASAKMMARLASAFGVDEVPKNMTRLAYLRIAMKDSPGLWDFPRGGRAVPVARGARGEKAVYRFSGHLPASGRLEQRDGADGYGYHGL